MPGGEALLSQCVSACESKSKAPETRMRTSASDSSSRSASCGMQWARRTSSRSPRLPGTSVLASDRPQILFESFRIKCTFALLEGTHPRSMVTTGNNVDCLKGENVESVPFPSHQWKTQ